MLVDTRADDQVPAGTTERSGAPLAGNPNLDAGVDAARKTHRDRVDSSSNAPTPTHRAGMAARATAGPADVTRGKAGHADLEGGALSGVGERQLHREVDILTAAPGLQGLAAHHVPEAVVEGARGRITEDAVGPGDLLEQGLGLGIPEVHVRRVLAGQLSV